MESADHSGSHRAGALPRRPARRNGKVRRERPQNERRIYLAMSRRSVSLPAYVSVNLVPRCSSRPPPFQALNRKPIHLSLEEPTSVTCLTLLIGGLQQIARSVSLTMQKRAGMLPFCACVLCTAA